MLFSRPSRSRTPSADNVAIEFLDWGRDRIYSDAHGSEEAFCYGLPLQEPNLHKTPHLQSSSIQARPLINPPLHQTARAFH